MGVGGGGGLLVAFTSFRASEHTFVRLHQVRARHLFAVCGELISTQGDASGVVGVGGFGGGRGSTRSVPCGFLTAAASRICWCN